MLEAVFANLATAFSAQFGAPYAEATAIWPGTPTKDAGGSITAPGDPVELPCRVQGEAAAEAMRADAGFIATDQRLLILGLTALDTSAEIVVATGPHAGRWALLSATRDPAGIGFECRGRLLP